MIEYILIFIGILIIGIITVLFHLYHWIDKLNKRTHTHYSYIYIPEENTDYLGYSRTKYKKVCKECGKQVDTLSEREYHEEKLEKYKTLVSQDRRQKNDR
jgi:acyl-CoA synthetase (AMP-forming)/AMP-acid ligase II